MFEKFVSIITLESCRGVRDKGKKRFEVVKESVKNPEEQLTESCITIKESINRIKGTFGVKTELVAYYKLFHKSNKIIENIDKQLKVVKAELEKQENLLENLQKLSARQDLTSNNNSGINETVTGESERLLLVSLSVTEDLFSSEGLEQQRKNLQARIDKYRSLVINSGYLSKCFKSVSAAWNDPEIRLPNEVEGSSEILERYHAHIREDDKYFCKDDTFLFKRNPENKLSTYKASQESECIPIETKEGIYLFQTPSELEPVLVATDQGRFFLRKDLDLWRQNFDPSLRSDRQVLVWSEGIYLSREIDKRKLLPVETLKEARLVGASTSEGKVLQVFQRNSESSDIKADNNEYFLIKNPDVLIAYSLMKRELRAIRNESKNFVEKVEQLIES